MEDTPVSIRPPPPPEPGSFAWKGLLLAILVCPMFGLIWAWAAEGAQWYFAPIILFPILLGAVVGITVVGLVRLTQVGHRPTILLAAVLAAGIAGSGPHYFSYLAAYERAGSSIVGGAASQADVAVLVRQMKPSFVQYLEAQARRGRPLALGYVAKGWAAWLSWALDALLVVAAAVAVTIPALRAPYCNRCRTWYRAVRSGRLDLTTGQRLAELLRVEEISQPRSFRCRLSACQRGCGPTRCELSWEEAGGAIDLVEAWLDAAGRNQVVAILDEIGVGKQESEFGGEEK
jgi:hypothetical protein